MTIRLATDQDWPSIYPFYVTITAEGKTCAFPEKPNSGRRSPPGGWSSPGPER
jgi:hypothetical protein